MTGSLPGPRIDGETRKAVLRSLAEKLTSFYILPEVARLICASLQQHLEAGDYAEADEAELFALALTLHLQEVSHDEHLWVRWHADPLPEADGQLRLNPEWQAERQLEARLDAYGIHKVERLAGNIGYLDLRHFHRPEWAGEAVAAAMGLVADAHALILDLRRCTGGFPATVALVCSYLFGQQSLLLNSIYWRDDNTTQEFWTQPQAPGKHFGDQKPVYVLTSRVTFSAGEECADILQSRLRAIVIGEKTDGGAHPGASYRLHPHFEVFVPIGKSTNPVSGADWEATGIQPDISVPPEQALHAAHIAALQSILAGLGESRSGPLQALAGEARTALKELEADGMSSLR
jgi:hypothetical protein